MAFDPARHQVVLFGGTSGFPFYNDTWIWNGVDWQQAHPAVSPPARADPGMAYDSTHHQIVLFGGWGPGPVLNDTWTWDGTNWTEQHPTTSPSPRLVHALTDDPPEGGLILFGGISGPGGNDTPLGDTWKWDGTNWVQLDPAASPSPRHATSAWSPALGRIVLFGGYDGTYLGDTWSFDGSTWTELSPSTSPGPRMNNGMATLGGKIVVALGWNGVTHLGDTWFLLGGTWRQLTGPGPGARTDADMTSDPSRHEILLFGGAVPADLFVRSTWTLG
jgi:hypothetical protein